IAFTTRDTKDIKVENVRCLAFVSLVSFVVRRTSRGPELMHMRSPRLNDRTTYNFHMDKDFNAVILSACRTPIGSFGGALASVSAVDLATVVIREAIARAGVQPSDIGDVI